MAGGGGLNALAHIWFIVRSLWRWLHINVLLDGWWGMRPHIPVSFCERIIQSFMHDALVSKGSFMQTKYLLIHIWIKGEVGAVKPV